MRPEMTVFDHIIENDLRGDESWEAARHLGQQLVRHMRSDGISLSERQYYTQSEPFDSVLVSVSEQPDLTGDMYVSLFKGEGNWTLSRPKGPSYHDLYSLPQRTGSYLSFSLTHKPTEETVLKVALPLTPLTGHLLKNGHVTSYTNSVSQRGIMDRYAANDLVFEPRRLQAAAFITKYIITENIQPKRPSATLSDDELAFLEKYFPYQDLPITGGGGKTVRRRHIWDGKRKTYTLAELQAMSGPKRDS